MKARKLWGAVVSIMLSLCVLLTGCAKAPSAGSSTAAEGNGAKTKVVTFEKDEAKTTLTVPSTWRVEKSDSGNITITPDTFDGLIQLGLMVSPMTAFSSDEEVIEFWNSSDSTLDTNWETISKTKAHVFQTTMSLPEGKKAKGFARLAISGNYSVGTYALAAGSDYKRAESDLKKVVESFTIKNAQEPVYISGQEGSANEGQQKAQKTETKPNVKTYKSGSYRVGQDIGAGEYKLTSTGSHAYFCVYPDTTKTNILTNGNFTTCSYVAVSEGQLLEVRGSTFVAIADATPTKKLSGEGIYKVGLDIPAGEYNITSSGDLGYYAVLGTVDANETYGNIINNDNFEGNSFVSVADGQYLEIARASIGS